MIRIVSILLVGIISVLVTAAPSKPQYDLNDAPDFFEKFVQEHHRVYKSDADREKHYEAFVNSLKVINTSNAASDSATFDINEFADYTPEERRRMHGVH